MTLSQLKQSCRFNIGEILTAMESLDEQDRLALSMQYGLNGEQPSNRHAIAARLGITFNNARWIISRAMRRLRAMRAWEFDVREVLRGYVGLDGNGHFVKQLSADPTPEQIREETAEIRKGWTRSRLNENVCHVETREYKRPRKVRMR